MVRLPLTNTEMDTDRTLVLEHPRTIESETSRTQETGRRMVRLRLYAIAGPFVLLFLLWLWVFAMATQVRIGPTGTDFGSDSGMLIAGATVLQHGGNLYDQRLLVLADDHLLARAGLPSRGTDPIVRFGYPPLFAWLLQPFVGMPFQVFAWAWSLFLLTAAATGFVALLSWFGWRRRVLPTLVFLGMPFVIFGPYYGNPVPLVFGALAGALWLQRRHPVLAGLLLSAAWLKPQVGLPAVLLILLFHTENPRLALRGVVAGTAAFAALTFVLTGRFMDDWVVGLAGYSSSIRVQNDLASLAGLYYRVAGSDERLLLGAVSLAAVAALTIIVWIRTDQGRSAGITFAWLWAAWMLAVPYNHFDDEILLAIPILIACGRDGRRALDFAPASVLYLYLLGVGIWKIPATDFSPLPLALLAITICLGASALRPGGLGWKGRQGKAPGGGGGIRTPEALRS